MKTKILHKFIGSLFLLLLSCITVVGQVDLANFHFNAATCAGGIVNLPVANVSADIFATSCGTCTINTSTGTAAGGGAFIANPNDNHSYESCPYFFNNQSVTFRLNGTAVINYYNFDLYFQTERISPFNLVPISLTIEWSSDNVNWNESRGVSNITNVWQEVLISDWTIPNVATLYIRITNASGWMGNWYIDNLQVRGILGTPSGGPTYTNADAGENQNQCGATTITLNGNDPVPPAGYTKTVAWTYQSSTPAVPGGQQPTILPTNTAAAIATIHTTYPEAADYSYIFRYTIVYTNTVSPFDVITTYDEITVNNYRHPDFADAGTDQNLCYTGSAVPTTMAAVPLLYGLGVWSQASGPGTATFTNVNDPVTTVSLPLPGTYQFNWTSYNPDNTVGFCAPFNDVVKIYVWGTPIASAGVDQNVCYPGAVQLDGSGTTGDVLLYTWTKPITADGSFNNINSQSPIYTPGPNDYAAGSVLLTVTTAGYDGCASTQDQILITFDKAAPALTCPPTINYSGCSTLDVVTASGFDYSEVPVTNVTELQWTTAGGLATDITTLSYQYQDSKTGTCTIVVSRVWTVTDLCGQASSCTQTINITDDVAPSLDGSPYAGLTGINACLEDAPDFDGVSAIINYVDNCGGAVTAVLTDTQESMADGCHWTVTFTYTVKDACGNELTGQTYSNSGNDQVPPVLTLGSIGACYATQALAEAAAIAATDVTDNCGGTLTKTASTTGTCSAVITVNAIDACGNNATPVTYYTRIDNTPPVLTLDPLFVLSTCYPTVSDAETAILAAFTASDLCSGTITPTASTTGTCSAVITITAEDECGNQATQVFNTRIDNEPPVLTPGTIDACYPTQAAAEAAAFAATTITDNCGGIVTSALTEGICDVTITLTAEDACGLTATIAYTTRIDDTPPVLTPGSINACYPTASAAMTAALAATSVSDGCPGTITPTATIDGTCTAVVTINAVDQCGNAATPVTYNTRVDNTGPVLTAGTIESCYPTVGDAEAAAKAATTATDGCGGIVLNAITVGDCAALITVSAVDACGNPSNSVTYNTRIDGTPPTVITGIIATCYPDLTTAQAAAVDSTLISDNCPGLLTTVITTEGTCEAVITLVVSDVCGNTAAPVVYNTRIDNTPPVLTAGTIDAAYATQAAAEAAALAATILTDNCSGGTKTVTTVGTCEAVITVNATDDCGLNAIPVTYTTKIDEVAPVVTQDEIGICYTTVELAEAAAIDATSVTDNCGGSVSITASTSGTCSAVITVTVTDELLNSTVVYYYTRIDNTPPALTAGSISACYASVELAEEAAKAATTYEDDCGDVVLSASTEGTCSATITVTAVDACGNQATPVTYQTRIDGTPPVITVGPIPSCFPTNDDAEAAVVLATTITDDCSAEIDLTKTVTVEGTCSAVITITAVDECGNTATKVIYNTVIDNTVPTITISGTIGSCYPTAAEAEAAAIAATTAADNCNIVTKLASTTGTCVATVSVVAQDFCGNTSEPVTFTTRVDNTGPVVTQGPIDACYATQAAAEAAALAATSAVDGCPGTLSTTVSTSGDCAAVITVTVKDECNNPTVVTYNTRIDNTLPVLSKGSIGTCYPTEEAAKEAAIAATGVTDNCPGTLTKVAVLTGDPCSAVITVSAYDQCGNTTTANVTYNTRVDNTPPVLVKTSISSCYPTEDAAKNAALAATSVSDNCSLTITKIATLTGDLCEATITISASDECGNAATVVTYNTRIDNTPPVLTKGTISSCYPTQALAEAAALAATVVTDNCPGTITPTASTSGTCTAVITISAVDQCGNPATVVTYNTRIDNTPPTWDVQPTFANYSCHSEVVEPGLPTATDNCLGQVTVTKLTDVKTETCTNKYTRVLTYSATDVCGNVSSPNFTFTINVNDVTAPTFTSPVNQSICSLPGLTYGIFPDPSVVAPVNPLDNCGGTVSFTHTINGGLPAHLGLISSIDQFPVGVNTVVYYAYDVCGNVSSQTFTVSVTQYQQADAGPDQDWCENVNAYLLGNFPNPGYTCTWAQVSPVSPLVTLFQDGDGEAVVDNLIPGTTYVFSYTLTNGPCTSTDYVTIVTLESPSPAVAGLDQEVCIPVGNTTTSFTLNAIDPEIGEGTWTQVAGAPVTITDDGLYNTTVTGAVADTFTFVWTVVNGVCPNNSDEVNVYVYAPVSVNAGPDFTLCPNYPSYTLSGASASNYSALFWSTSGTGYFDDVTAVNPTYYPGASDYENGTVTLLLTGYGQGPCGSLVDQMTLTIEDVTAPVILTECSSLNETLDIDPTNCSIVVPDFVPSIEATDNCAEPVITQSPEAGAIVNAQHGDIINVTITATDLENNIATCTIALTANDITAPVIDNCAALSQTLPLGDGCKITIPDFSELTEVTDCGPVTITQSIAAGSLVSSFHNGETTVLVTVADANEANATATCLVTLTAEDVTPPTITAITSNPKFDLNVYPANCTLTIPDLTGSTYVTASDNGCEYTLTQEPAAGDIVPAIHNELIPVVVTITDLAGFTAEATVTIEAIDNNAPTVATPTANITQFTDEDMCSAVVTYVAPTFYDNCTYTVAQVAGLESGSEFPKGTTTNTFVATDAAGNLATSSFTVTVVDNQAPVFTYCPENVVVDNDLNLCGAHVADLTPVAWDNCPGYTVVQTAGLAANALYPVGTTVNTYKVTDAAGLTAFCTYSVTVNDAEAPRIECPELAIFPNTPGMCGAVDLQLTFPTVVDNCTPTGSIFIEAITPEVYEYGINYVTWYATDLAGNVTSCVQVVEVIDTELPVVTCPDNITVTIGIGETTAIIPEIGMATATDNCWVIGILNDAPANNEYPAGFNYVTWTAVDAAYNEGTCVQTIYVINPNYPAVTCPANVVKNNTVGSCGTIVNNIAPTEVGGTGTMITYTLSGATTGTGDDDASGVFFNVGVTTVTYTASNQYGPDATCTFTVTVIDNQPPSIQCPAAVTVNVNAGTCSASNVALGTPTLSDNCSGTISWTTSGIPAGGIFPLGVTNVTYTATDIAGNTANCVQVVTVVDNIKPVFTSVPANITRNDDADKCYASGITPALIGLPTATDNCGTPTITSTGIIPTGEYPTGVTHIIWTANDGHGNTATALTTITVVDNQVPQVLNAGGNKNVHTDLNHCFATVTNIDPVYIHDNCPSYVLTYTMTGATTASGPLLANGNSFQFNKGVTTVVYTITDASGNTSSTPPFTVTVTDIQNPTVTCPPNVVVNADAGVCYATNVILGNAIYSDNCGTATPTVTGIPINGHYPKGVTTITYAVSDLSGNVAIPCTQTVTVVDNVPPVFTFCPINVTAVADEGQCYATIENPGGIANAEDICDGTLPVVSSVPIGYHFPVGTTTVYYVATDLSGNMATCTQIVTVTDDQAPTITCPPDVLNAVNPITLSDLGSPTVGDNCGVLSIVANIPFNGNFPLDVPTAVVWVVTDLSGNTSNCTQMVTATSGSPVYQLTGRMSYNNTISTPINNSTVNLTQNNTVVATTTTDADGNYTFTDVVQGDYAVNGAITKPWGGGNATDALLILRHFVSLQQLVNLPKYAADVNGNGYINSLDALLVAKRFTQSINSFPAGDWVTEDPSITLDQNTIMDVLALCMGDVNGSYVPPTVKLPSTVNLNSSGNIYVKSFEEFELPVNTTSPLTTGAVSMVIDYPADLFDVTGVRMADPNIDNMIYTINNGTIRLAWYTTDKLNLNSDEALLTLKLKAKDLRHLSSDIALTLDGVSEIADETGAVLQVNLNMPKLSLATEQANVNVYPNPFKNRTEFVYTLPEQANVNIKVFDMLGNEVSTLVNETQIANTYHLTFDAAKLLPGVYTYKVIFNSSKGEDIRTGRLVITK